MRFPKHLYSNGKENSPLDSSKIKFYQYLYMRVHHSHWDDKDEFPGLNVIKTDQSLNWGAFSIPIWARFDDNKNYKIDNGVIGVKVKAIISNYRSNHNNTDANYPLILHKPLQNNYSHCELNNYLKDISKSKKRDYRFNIKNNCKIFCKPNEIKMNSNSIKEHIVMYFNYLVSIFCFWIK